MASRVGPQTLAPFGGPPRGFSFAAEVQPILDRHCTRCHDGGESFSLLGRETVEEASGRRWSDAYLALTKAEHRLSTGSSLSSAASLDASRSSCV